MHINFPHQRRGYSNKRTAVACRSLIKRRNDNERTIR